VVVKFLWPQGQHAPDGTQRMGPKALQSRMKVAQHSAKDARLTPNGVSECVGGGGACAYSAKLVENVFSELRAGLRKMAS
jgi:hypothetical protein